MISTGLIIQMVMQLSAPSLPFSPRQFAFQSKTFLKNLQMASHYNKNKDNSSPFLKKKMANLFYPLI